MNIDLIISADDIKKEKVKDKTAVVIDMLRATSVIITALSNGCSEVNAVLSVDEAFKICKSDRSRHILGGERKALKIDGFDFSNSPLEYTKEKVSGKKLIITTTNGTRAIKGSIGAENILIGAVINGLAVAKKAASYGNDIVFVNSGTDGRFSIDDFICSGYIIDRILEINPEFELTDAAFTADYVYRQNKDILSFVKNAHHYKIVKKLGLDDDVNYCVKKDIINIVPEYRDGIIKVF